MARILGVPYDEAEARYLLEARGIFPIAYPENGYRSEADIRVYYSDAVANGEAEGGFTELPDQMAALEDAGLVTFACKYR
jgi:hypothetical protein